MTRTAEVHPRRTRHATATLSPIVRAVLDAVDAEIAVLDPDGRVVYLNARASAAHATPSGARPDGAALRSTLLARRGRASALEAGGTLFGELLVVSDDDARPWSHREREAIRQTLARAGGKRGETARQLGISRTTLWRRLRASTHAARL